MKQKDSYYEGERPELKPFLPKTYERVLEIGCGDGSFKALLPASSEYWGVEPEPAAAELAEKHLTRVLRGTIEIVADQLPDRYFDLVICNDVIEHIPDTDFLLTVIQNKLTSDGKMIGSIPNVRYYKNLFGLIVNKDWRYADKGILDSTHMRFFTRKSLHRCLTSSGFEFEKFKGINSAVYLKKKTPGNLLKYLLRLIGFLLLDICTFGHSIDIKYAQFAFRCALK